MKNAVADRSGDVGARHAAPLLLLLVLAACSGAGEPGAPAGGPTLFTRLPSSETGVVFENRLAESREFNVFTYRNYYNGGGVALGDNSRQSGVPGVLLH
ncbi:MAG TPA: hypothetical protein VN953_11315 [Gemmatimonadales bacterium]|nr:hypothetical protein [Gemmatimonadales bacterium]